MLALLISAASVAVLGLVAWRLGLLHRVRALDVLDVDALGEQDLRTAFTYLIARYRTRNKMIAIGFAVLVLSNAAAVKWAVDGSKEADRTATVAQSAARDAKAAADRTRHLVARNRANARAAKVLAQRLNDALCVFVGELRGRARDTSREIAQTEKFLREGGHIQGISDKVLRDSLRSRRETLTNLRSTIASFEALDCSVSVSDDVLPPTHPR